MMQNLSKVNIAQEKQYRNLLPQDHMQFKDAVTIADCHQKEKTVLSDSLVALKTLQLNFQKWFNEYNIATIKLKTRDTIKQKLEKTQNEVEKTKLQRDFEFQNMLCYEVIYQLVETRYNMLNPIITKWIQIQTIFYSKSFAHFSPIGSVDPNTQLTEKKIYSHVQDNQQAIRPTGSFVHADDGPRKDNLVKKMEAIAYSEADSSQFQTNELNKMVADVPLPSDKTGKK